MKKIILLVLGISLSASTFAQQTDKLKVLAGGVFNMDFGSSNSTTNFTAGSSTQSPSLSTFDLSFTPDVGVFLFKNFALGLQLESSVSSSKQDTIKSSNSSFNIGPFVRYYYKIGNMAPFLQLGYGVGTISTSGTGISASTIKGSVLSVGPGFAYFINDRMGIEALLNYQHLSQSTDINAGGISNRKNNGNRLKFNVGIQIYL